MLRTRVIPALLIKDGGLIKTVRFNKEKYVGDPINAIKIYNDKEVDELIALDISATRRGSIDFDLLSRINKEAFMPLGYGGGIKTLDQVKKILQLGYEKIVINSIAIDNPKFIESCAKACGSQSVVCCIDTKKTIFGVDHVYDYRTKKLLKETTLDQAKLYEKSGCGELLLYSVDNDGVMDGYDLKIIKSVASDLQIPIVSLGGAATIEDFRKAIKEAGASAVAAGSMFVFYGPHKAVLISYPSKKELKELFK